MQVEAVGEAGGLAPARAGIPERIGLGLSQLVLAAMMILIAAEVGFRSLFHGSFEFTDEVVSYLLVSLFFLSVGAGHMNGAFHRVELVQARLSPRGRLISRVCFDALALIACLVLLWYLSRFWRISFQRGEVSNSLLRTPLWIPRLVLPLGTALLCWALAKTLLQGARALFRQPAR